MSNQFSRQSSRPNPNDRPPATKAADTAEQPAPLSPPSTPEALFEFIHAHFELSLSRRPLMRSHAAPFDYLVHAFFEGAFTAEATVADPAPADCVVWANRGGGKTMLAALATALDLLFKPGIEIKLVGGSLEQSARVYQHLRRLLDSPVFQGRIAGRISEKRVTLRNGSRAEILAQSQTAVRGVRVQKIRCDEVELFHPELWEAAQLTTRSMPCPGPWGSHVRGSVEAFSTMHLPMGLMWQITSSAEPPSRLGRVQKSKPVAPEDRESPLPPASPEAPDPVAGPPPRVLFRWGVLDVLEPCGPQHQCDTCSLASLCKGRAKERTAADGGHISVADALAARQRVGAGQWESEMLCLRASRAATVFPEFDTSIHVRPSPAPTPGDQVLGGIDFGFRCPFVALWARLTPSDVLHVFDEYICPEGRLDEHMSVIKERGVPDWLGIDPAGNQANDQTAISSAQQLKNAGFKVRSRHSRIHQGILMVRQRLDVHNGPRLFISPNCTHLITCMSRYRYPPKDPRSLEPLKDGHDHAVDALRYLITVLDSRSAAKRSDYAEGEPC